MTVRGHKLIVREDYEHGYVAVLRDQYGKQLEEIKTRSVEYLNHIARNYNAEITPKRFKL